MSALNALRHLVIVAAGASCAWAGEPPADPFAPVMQASAPEPITVPSEGGPVPAVRRTYRALVKPYFAPIEAVCLGDPLAILINPLYAPPQKAQYFRLGQRLMSAEPCGSYLDLCLGLPVPAGETSDSFVERRIDLEREAQLRGSPYENPRLIFSLDRIFGARSLRPPTSMNWDIATITDVLPARDAVTLTLRTEAGAVLALKFSPDLQLLSATENGTPFPTLIDGQVTAPGAPGAIARWVQRREFVPSPEGPLAAVFCEKGFDAPGVEMRGGIPAVRPLLPYAAGARVLVLPSGDVWVGPSGCRMVAIGGKIIGFKMSGISGELLAFVGPRIRIPMGDQERLPAARNIFSQVEAQMAARLMPPDKTMKVASLFGNDPLLAKDPEIGVRSVALNGSNIVLGLKTQKGPLTLEFSPDLDLISAQVDPPPTNP